MFSWKKIRLVYKNPLTAVQRVIMPELAAFFGLYSIETVFPITVSETGSGEDSSCLYVIEDFDEDGTCILDREQYQVSIKENRLSYRFLDDQEGLAPAIVRSFLQDLTAVLLPVLGICDTEIPKDYQPAPVSPDAEMNRFPNRHHGLEAFFRPGYLLKDTDRDGLSDSFSCRIRRPHTDDAVLAACDLSWRIGMETTGLRFPLLSDEAENSGAENGEAENIGAENIEVKNSGANVLYFAEDGEAGIQLEADQPAKIRINGSGEALRHFMSSFCMKYDADRNEPDLQEKCEYYREQPAFHEECIMERSFSFPEESEAFRQAVRNAAENITPGKPISYKAAVSEELSVRKELMKEAERVFFKAGASSVSGTIICSYKQGFSWCEEIVLPKLAELSTKIEKIVIYYQEYQSEDQNTMEVSIRHLQMLFPIDEVMAPKLSLRPEQIVFEKVSSDAAYTYQVCAFDACDRVLLEEQYLIRDRKSAFLYDFPECGTAHPESGYLQAEQDGETIYDCLIRGARDEIWDVFQKEVLPYCRSYILHKKELNPKAVSYDLGRLCMEISLSEPEYLLGVRSEMCSPCDGLHEDLYFTAISYLQEVRKAENVGGEVNGIVLPMITIRRGETTVRLLHKVNTASPETDREAETEQVRITEINRDLSMKLEISKNGTFGETRYVMRNARFESISGSEEVPAIREDRKEEVCQDLSIEDIDIPSDKLIGYEQYISIIQKLRKVKGIQVCSVGKSAQGREIYAIRVGKRSEQFVSAVHRITEYPTMIINGRHHANEVSATNALLLLVKELLTDPAYADIDERMNLIILPMENPDGTEIHFELAKEHPLWKFHSARYNAYGKEFAGEYFKEHTMHTEALAVTSLFYRWLPDVYADNHGVPTHEWEQSFTGYIPKNFANFWLARSIYYTYHFGISGEEYAWNHRFAERFKERMFSTFPKEGSVSELNQAYRRSYIKYANEPMPELYPVEGDGNIIHYDMNIGYRPKFSYFAIGFPWITTLSFVGEISDETASEKDLSMCADIQKKQMLAGISLLSESHCIIGNTVQEEQGGVYISHKRLRPVLS